MSAPTSTDDPAAAAAFIAQWGPGGPSHGLNEEQGAQSHFMGLCDLLGVPRPGTAHDGGYRFEEKSAMVGGRTGYADVSLRGHFAWENKAPGKNLDAALRQLLSYSLALQNPPLLVVCDRLTIRIHTQFNGHPSEVHTVTLQELATPEARALLRRLWTDPESFRPKKTSRDITEAAARSFANLAEQLRKRGESQSAGEAGSEAASADQVAHFLTQCLFCFFAEDVGLLPGRLFERLVNNRHITSERLTEGLADLFTTMRSGGMFGVDGIPWFNGGLFQTIAVPRLQVPDVTELRSAAGLNWSAIDVSIFGTLFERGLDPAKRSQLGAHYTDPATIERIIGPVIRRPLLQLWEQEKTAIQALQAKSTKKGDKNSRAARERFIQWLQHLAAYRVLDPACGSGNFLFLGLKALKDVEHQSHLEAALLGLDREADLVTGPHNVLGIELNEYAAELARVTVWIGELQWRIEHGYEFKTNPVLEPLDHIECRDALLSATSAAAENGAPAARPKENGVRSEFRTARPPEAGSAERNSALTPLSAPASSQPTATEAPWPQASVVIGNPPFLGDKKMRAELGDAYTTQLRKTYEGRVPGGADLVCYWFEKARKAIETNGLGAAGLVATNSIRGGKNRQVLDAIAQTTRIFEAWSDEGWVNEGAAVRVSLVCFGNVAGAKLNGSDVSFITTQLERPLSPMVVGTQILVEQVKLWLASNDLSKASRLGENAASCFEGIKKYGPFDIPGETARQWLKHGGNPNQRPNSDVLRPWINATDVVRKDSDTWVIDFTGMSENEAALFEKPFEHAKAHVQPARAGDRNAKTRDQWWLYERPRLELRKATEPLHRYIVTPVVAKHRVFAWRSAPTLAMNLLDVTARADDTTFGILHSRFHELWSLRMGTSLEDRPRYTPTTCFETFPFPAGLTPADTAHQRTETLASGAVIPAGLAGPDGAISEPNRPLVHASGSSVAINIVAIRAAAERIASAAQRLNTLREAWLNPPEWTQRVPEVVPLGLERSPYPDRIVARPGHEKDLADRTLTKLYNARPAWLAAAHHALDAAVAAAYALDNPAWADYSPDLPDDEILKRLLALNLARAAAKR